MTPDWRQTLDPELGAVVSDADGKRLVLLRVPPAAAA